MQSTFQRKYSPQSAMLRVAKKINPQLELASWRTITSYIEKLLVFLCRKGWGVLEGLGATGALGFDGLAVGVPWACKEPHECMRYLL
jgi:hypothetical protein